MNKLRSSIVFIILILTFVFSSKVFCQTNIKDNNNQKTFDLLLERKTQLNNQFSLYPNYSLQLKNGLKEEAEEVYKNFTTAYPEIDATIVFANPKFKVIVGNFKHKIEAENLLKKINSKFPDAFIVKLKP